MCAVPEFNDFVLKMSETEEQDHGGNWKSWGLHSWPAISLNNTVMKCICTAPLPCSYHLS